ncbi:RELA [Mytilus edulis]|uniref:RELA n=1 Tax=Mytilus edulis TaxID=6550 RepID=A0A8S3T632_MYTED|nr:RELA [Mytilus edulis]
MDKLDANHVHFTCSLKGDLQDRLNSAMHGIGKPPALMLPNPKMTSHDLNIKNYEIPCFEPLHDLANMIKNVITELPYQIKDPIIQKKLLHFSHTTNGERNEIRGPDARLALIKLSQFLDEINSKKRKLMRTLYKCEGRTQKLIPRLYNQTMLFAATCRTMFCSPVKMTTRKFFGSHFHRITIHLAEAFIIFSLRSILTEEQERCFGDLRRISRNTTNRQPGNIAENCIVRFNYQQKEGNKQNFFHMLDSFISKQARLLKQHPRSAFTA